MALSPSEAFGEAIRQVRQQKELSQENAALESGIDRAYYGHIERASKTPTLTTVFKIAKALETTPSELLKKAEELMGDAD